MPQPAGLGRKWRRFNRKYRTAILITWVLVGTVLLVGFLMWMLSSPQFRARWQ